MHRPSPTRVAARFLAADKSMTMPAFKRLVQDVAELASTRYDWAHGLRFTYGTPKYPPHTMADPSKALAATYTLAGREFILYWTPEVGLFSNAGSRVRGMIPWMGRLTPAQAAEQLVNFALYAHPQELLRKTAPPTQSTPGSGQTWSVVTTGSNHGYAVEVEIRESKTDAEAYAREIGGAYVLKGTQMWNEPVGQVEESDRPATYRWVS